ncbi:MAG: hypothetical protein V3U88_11635 [Methylococcales bacterium]
MEQKKAIKLDKKPWFSPIVTKLGTISEVVQSGKGKTGSSEEGMAGGSGAEFKPGT